MTKAQKQEQTEAVEKLREWIKPGDTVYTILDHVSRSGMQREIRVAVPYVRTDGRLAGRIDFVHPNYLVAQALGWRQSTRGGGRRDGLVVGGCGMDMGFHLVYSLSRVMHPAGFGCIGEGCPSNDHSNGDFDRTPHACTEGVFPEQHLSAKPGTPGCHWHKDGGYALRSQWL